MVGTLAHSYGFLFGVLVTCALGCSRFGYELLPLSQGDGGSPGSGDMGSSTSLGGAASGGLGGFGSTGGSATGGSGGVSGGAGASGGATTSVSGCGGPRCDGAGNCYTPPSVLHFAATDARAEFPHSAVLDLGAEFTLEFWLCVVSFDGGQYIFQKHDGIEGKQFDINPSLGNALEASFFVGPAAGDNLAGATRAPPALDEWMHVAASVTGSTLRLYVDGRLVMISAVSNRVQNSTAIVYLGSAIRNGSDTPGADVMLSDFRWSSVNRYPSGADFAPPLELVSDASTAALWRLDEGTGTSLSDTGPNGLDGMLSGGYAWVVP